MPWNQKGSLSCEQFTFHVHRKFKIWIVTANTKETEFANKITFNNPIIMEHLSYFKFLARFYFYNYFSFKQVKKKKKLTRKGMIKKIKKYSVKV